MLAPRWWPQLAAAVPHLAEKPPDVARDLTAPWIMAVREACAVGGANSIPWNGCCVFLLGAMIGNVVAWIGPSSMCDNGD
eukprot:11158515-Lingulodinium_polyedra.AAC.1